MATTVNNKRTFAKDIATISTALDGIVEFQSIEFSQNTYYGTWAKH